MDIYLKVLLDIGDKIIAEEIQEILEESNIFSILDSDNPASSILSIYSGINAIENITIRVNKNDYQNAVEILSKTQYKDLLDNT